jgi:hypothetical protein
MTLRVDSRPAIAEFPMNSSRERPALHGVGAEGATAPETLRQTDREELMNAGKQPAER